MTILKEILNIPELNMITIKAGKAGILRKVRWMHIMDTIQVGHFLEGGELIITSGEVWPKEISSEMNILDSFINNGVSGVVFATGHYFDRCPSIALEYGEKYNLPILEVPFEIPFVGITKIINEAILLNQYKKMNLFRKISYLEGKKMIGARNYSEVLNVLANNFGNNFLFFDNMSNKFYNAIPVNNRISFSYNDVDKESIKNLIANNSITNETYPSITILDIKQNEKIKAICIHTCNQFIGVLLFSDMIIEKGNTELIEYSTFIVIDLYLNFINKRKNQYFIQQEIIDYVTKNEDIYPKLIYDKIEKSNLKIYDVIVPVLICSNEEFNTYLKNDLEIIIAREYPNQAFFGDYRDNISLIFTSNDTEEKILNHIHKIFNELNNKYDLFFIVGDIGNRLLNVKVSFNKIIQVYQMIKNNGYTNTIFNLKNIHREIILYQDLTNGTINTLKNTLLPSFFYSDKGKIFYETLSILVKYNFNRDLTAKKLFIHKNTLQYRINKIEEVLKCKLSSFECMFWLKIAIDINIFNNNDN